MDHDQGNRQWVEHWRRLGPMLERIQRDELRNFEYSKQMDVIDCLLELGRLHAVPRTTSGLVQLQRWLQKVHR